MEELFAVTQQTRLEWMMRFPPPVRFYAPLLVLVFGLATTWLEYELNLACSRATAVSASTSLAAAEQTSRSGWELSISLYPSKTTG
jgi:hypothetical protein